jgi:hypothetical protein
MTIKTKSLWISVPVIIRAVVTLMLVATARLRKLRLD